jgi:hypothetical protein
MACTGEPGARVDASKQARRPLECKRKTGQQQGVDGSRAHLHEQKCLCSCHRHVSAFTFDSVSIGLSSW